MVAAVSLALGEGSSSHTLSFMPNRHPQVADQRCSAERPLTRPTTYAHSRGARRCWTNTGPISLSSHGVMWRFLAAPSGSDGASSDRFERAWEGSIPFLGTRVGGDIPRALYPWAVVKANTRGSSAGAGWQVRLVSDCLRPTVWHLRRWLRCRNPTTCSNEPCSAS